MSDESNDERNFDFELDFPFKYGTKAGDREEATFIELRPPTTQNSRECAYLKQAFFRAANDQDDDDTHRHAHALDAAVDRRRE